MNTRFKSNFMQKSLVGLCTLKIDINFVLKYVPSCKILFYWT